METTQQLAAAIESATLDQIERPGRHDAVVIGGGAAGGLAAALLTQAGLRVLVLDAGWRAPFRKAPLRRSIAMALAMLAHPKAIALMPPSLRWKGERALRLMGQIRQPVQSSCYAWPSAVEQFVDDRECPYDTPPDQPYQWIRARGLGGRMVVPLHGRQYYRLGPTDFRPTDGLSPPWPFEPADLDPWYELVERRLHLSGRADHSRWIPDSLLADVRDASPAEAAFMQKVLARYPRAEAILGRFAPPMDSLAEAATSGRLLCRTGAIVRHIELDEQGRAAGVVFHDRRAGSLKAARAPLIFLCASTLESTRILLTSRSDRHPEGIGGNSGCLGRHLMDHVTIKAEGMGPAIAATHMTHEMGPCVYLPRFNGRAGGDCGAERGFGIRVYQSPASASASYFTAVADAEMLPRPENRVTLSSRRDAWGLPTLHIACSCDAAELAVAKLQVEALRELAEIAGARLHGYLDTLPVPGSSIHECGTARMGSDPGQSVLDPFNECWDAKGLFVTDGAAFPSLGLQNPTLTILALTARACHHAASR
jgi:choline dehydrogenase-like flavoprotein